MKIIKPYTEIVSYTPDLEKIIELAGRVCYKSEDKITKDSAASFIERLKNMKHESVLEHGSITVRFVVDRGVSHELVRHRLASFSQESTRYCNYKKEKFGREITVIEPCYLEPQSEAYQVWHNACLQAEQAYFRLLDFGVGAQKARAVLPTSLKTEIVVSANPREWRHIFTLRCHNDAHPQMVEVMRPLLEQFAVNWPVLFDDVLKSIND